MRVFLAVALLLALAVVGLALWGNWDTASPGVDTSSLTREAVPGHVAALTNADAGARARAADSLWKIGVHAREATPALLTAARDPDPQVREAAARALGRTSQGTRDAVPALTTALQDDQAAVRASAAAALAEIWMEERHGPLPAGQQVPRPNVDPGPEARELHRAAVPALTALLRDTDPRARAKAAAALAEVSPLAGPALPDLIAVIEKDPITDARLQAVLVLDNLGPPARAGVAALAGRVRGDSDAGVRANAAHALGTIQADPEVAVPVLFEAYLTDEVGDVRNIALWSIGQFGGQARLAEARAREVANAPADRVSEEVRRRAARFLEQLEKRLAGEAPKADGVKTGSRGGPRKP